MTTATALYRHFANDGSLLYVGISLSWPSRTKSHASGSRWFDQVARVEIEQFPSREAALEAEREAIKRERPKFNIIHNTAATRKKNVGKRYFYRKAPVITEASCRFMGAKERRRALDQRDPIFKVIKGPGAIVGPALIYRDDTFSMMVAHGEFGTEGELTEIVLGAFAPEMPEWANVCASVISIRRPNDLTTTEARDLRDDIVRKLRQHLVCVETFNSDLSLAVAYAHRFPSKKSRKVLDDVAVERGAAA